MSQRVPHSIALPGEIVGGVNLRARFRMSSHASVECFAITRGFITPGANPHNRILPHIHSDYLYFCIVPTRPPFECDIGRDEACDESLNDPLPAQRHGNDALHKYGFSPVTRPPSFRSVGVSRARVVRICQAFIEHISDALPGDAIGAIRTCEAVGAAIPETRDSGQASLLFTQQDTTQ